MKPTPSMLARSRSSAVLLATALLLSGAGVAIAQDAPTPPPAPKAPATKPQAPAAPSRPQAPAAPSKPQTPAAPDMPKMPEMPKMPQMPAGSTAPTVTPVADAPTPQVIFAKFIEATGGPEAFPKEGSRRTKGRIMVPAAGLEGTMETLVRTPKMVLIRTTLPGVGDILQGYDGTIGWTVDPMGGERLLEPAELEPLLRATDLRGPAGFLDQAKSSKTLGSADFHGTDSWAVELTGLFGDGETLLYFSRADGLLNGMRMTTQSAMGAIPVESVISDYKQFGKAKLATKTTSRAMMQEIVSTIDDVADAEIPVADFAPPASVQALIDAKKAGGTGASGAPGAPKAPDAPKAPKAPEAPKTPKAPDAPKAPKSPDAPKAP